MNLYYINLRLDYETYIDTNNDLRFEFQQRTNFISDYFSKAVRKLKYKTDGTFNMIAVSLTEFEVEKTSIVPVDVLKVYLSFNKKDYETAKKMNDFNYYLSFLEKGFKKASKFKPIPLPELLDLITEFKNGGCKNEWLHKKKRFKEEDLEISLICEFTTNYFQLIFVANQLSTKKELVRGAIIKTDVGISIHEGMYKDILIDKDKNKIIITDRADGTRVVIKKNDVLNGKLSFKINGNEEIKKYYHTNFSQLIKDVNMKNTIAINDIWNCFIFNQNKYLFLDEVNGHKYCSHYA